MHVRLPLYIPFITLGFLSILAMYTSLAARVRVEKFVLEFTETWVMSARLKGGNHARIEIKEAM